MRLNSKRSYFVYRDWSVSKQWTGVGPGRSQTVKRAHCKNNRLTLWNEQDRTFTNSSGGLRPLIYDLTYMMSSLALLTYIDRSLFKQVGIADELLLNHLTEYCSMRSVYRLCLWKRVIPAYHSVTKYITGLLRVNCTLEASSHSNRTGISCLTRDAASRCNRQCPWFTEDVRKFIKIQCNVLWVGCPNAFGRWKVVGVVRRTLCQAGNMTICVESF